MLIKLDELSNTHTELASNFQTKYKGKSVVETAWKSSRMVGYFVKYIQREYKYISRLVLFFN